MTLRAVVAQDVEAGPSEAWEVLVDFAAYPERMASYESLELLSVASGGLGTRWRQTRTVYGRSHSQVMEVTRWEEPTLLELEAGERGARYRTTYVLVESASGTRVEMRFEVEATNPLARAFQRLFGARLMRSTAEAMEKDLEDLLAACR